MTSASLTEWLLQLVPVLGPWLVGAITFASCLALPVPASLAMLVAGAFAAAGDLSLPLVLFAAFSGAIMGDAVGFSAGRLAHLGLARHLARSPRRERAYAAASARLKARAIGTVFLTRWLLSPLGPWVNLAAGATGIGWAPFALGVLGGEVLWVVIYVGLGWVFAAQVDWLASLMGNLVGLAVALAVAALALRLLWQRARPGHRHAG
jgi:membrane protein DedA with SNARE-associated domain